MSDRVIARSLGPRFSGGRYAEAEQAAAAKGTTIGQRYALPGYCQPR